MLEIRTTDDIDDLQDSRRSSITAFAMFNNTFSSKGEKDGFVVDERPIDFTNLPAGKDAEYRSKADELAGSVGADTIPGTEGVYGFDGL